MLNTRNMNFERLGKATPLNVHNVTAENYLHLGIFDIILSIKPPHFFRQLLFLLRRDLISMGMRKCENKLSCYVLTCLRIGYWIKTIFTRNITINLPKKSAPSQDNSEKCEEIFWKSPWLDTSVRACYWLHSYFCRILGPVPCQAKKVCLSHSSYSSFLYPLDIHKNTKCLGE